MFWESAIVSDVVHVFNMEYEKGGGYQCENRPWHGLVLPVSGSIRFTCGEQILTTDRNQAIFLPKGSSYSDVYTESGTTWIIDLNGESFPASPALFPNHMSPDIQSAHMQLQHTVLHPFSQRFMRLSCFYDMLSVLTATDIPVNMPHFPDILAPAILYMNRHFTEETLTLEHLAACANVSTVYFRKLFTDAAGISPMRYINQMRILYAKRLLLNTQMSITEIASQSGWQDVSYFISVFRRSSGTTPLQWRNNQKKENVASINIRKISGV